MKPLTACAALALAVHAGLLWLPGRLHAGGRKDAGSTQAVQVRLAPTEPAAVASAQSVEDAEPAQSEPAQPVSDAIPGAAVGSKTDDDAPDRFAPLLDGDENPVRLPDAPMPEHGADLRAYVRLNDQGRVEAVSVDSSTPDLPIAFNDVVEAGLRQSHLRAAQDADTPPVSGLAYCLAVRFEPDQPAPQLQWLPGAAANPTRCLNGKLPAAARDIERR